MPRSNAAKLKTARELLEAQGFDPLSALASIANDATIPLVMRQDAMKSLMPFVFPKLASTELTVDEAPELSEKQKIITTLARTNPTFRKLIEDAEIMIAQEAQRLRAEDARQRQDEDRARLTG